MRDYQRQKNNRYILPRALYHQTLWQIRDYYRLKEKADAILTESPAPADGMPRGTDISDQVADRAIKRETTTATIKIIEEERDRIPEEYRIAIWNNVMFGNPFPQLADRSTYGRHKSAFVYNVARRLFLI